MRLYLQWADKYVEGNARRGNLIFIEGDCFIVVLYQRGQLFRNPFALDLMLKLRVYGHCGDQITEAQIFHSNNEFNYYYYINEVLYILHQRE